MLGPRSPFSPSCYKSSLTVSDTVVAVIIWHRSWCRTTLIRSAIASAIISCIVICGIIRAAPATIVQGLAGGGLAAAPMMAATIVVRIMVGWIIHAATNVPPTVAAAIIIRVMVGRIVRTAMTSAIIIRIVICPLNCTATAINRALHPTK